MHSEPSWVAHERLHEGRQRRQAGRQRIQSDGHGQKQAPGHECMKGKTPAQAHAMLPNTHAEPRLCTALLLACGGSKDVADGAHCARLRGPLHDEGLHRT